MLRRRVTCPGVLIVDDLPEIREIIARLLDANGHAPCQVPSGPKAIALFEADPDAFSLAIIDLPFRSADGLECAARLRGIRPELPILFISGSPRPEEARRFKAEFLRKPFRLEAFETAVNRSFSPRKLVAAMDVGGHELASGTGPPPILHANPTHFLTPSLF